MKLDRRTMLACLALSGTLAACSGGTSGTLPTAGGFNNPTIGERGNSSPASTTLTFVNNSSTASNKVWFCYYGLDPTNGTPLYLSDAKGTLTKSVPNSKGTTSMCLNVGSSPSFVFPELNAARMYVSYGQPISFTVGGNARPVPPNPADSKDANYGTKWDFFELTYIPETGSKTGRFNFNLSVLQSANLNMRFAVKGLVPGTTTPAAYKRGWKAGGYAAFVKSMQANKDFAKLVLPGTQRVLAPGTAIQGYAQKIIPSPLMPGNYYHDYTASVWTKYAKDTLTFVGDPPAGSNKFVTWTGQVVKGQFVFTPPAGNTLGLKQMVWSEPTTSDIFENNFLFCVSGCGKPNTQQENYALQMFGTLIAAWNRSVMTNHTKFTNNPEGSWCTQSTWYQDPTTNAYSEYIHANSLQTLAYAFQSDDHCNVSSFVAVWNPTNFTITLQN